MSPKPHYAHSYRCVSMGIRVVKTVSEWDGSEWTQDYEKRFVYDGWNLIEEITAQDTTQTSK